ncbi:MAG: alanine racemase [Deltaproteobacteria bacterium]
MSIPSVNRVEVNLDSLQHNFRQIRKLLADQVEILPMVKAQAYGHGLEQAALALRAAGARYFGVAEVEEGVGLRRVGIDGNVVVSLGPSVHNLEEIVEFDLQPVVFDREALADLSKLAVSRGKRVAVHLKVDVGMGRLGAMPEQARSLAEAVAAMPGLKLIGLMSHFPSADRVEQMGTEEQLRQFAVIADELADLLPPDHLLHIANSAALCRLPDTHLHMVRPGIALYGCYPYSDPALQQRLDLRPVMSFKSSVVQVKEVPKGYGISYGHTFVTRADSRLAILPVGYDDGYLRRLSNRGQVLIGGRRAPIVGNVCMNACVADVTGMEAVAAGDEVVLLGRQGEDCIFADEIAGWMDTISYEVLCLFGGMNRRVYVNKSE